MLLALGAQTPEKIVAAGTLTPSGVDKAVGVTVVTGGKMASITYTVEAQTPEEWRIIGSTGMIVFNGPAHGKYTSNPSVACALYQCIPALDWSFLTDCLCLQPRSS